MLTLSEITAASYVSLFPPDYEIMCLVYFVTMSLGMPSYIFFSFKILDLSLLAIKKPERVASVSELTSNDRPLDSNGQDDASRQLESDF